MWINFCTPNTLMSDCSNFNKLVDYLNKTNPSYHTFLSNSTRLFRIFIRNLHHTALRCQYFCSSFIESHIILTKIVHNLKQNNHLPIFWVVWEYKNNNSDMNDIAIVHILNTNIEESYNYKNCLSTCMCIQLKNPNTLYVKQKN